MPFHAEPGAALRPERLGSAGPPLVVIVGPTAVGKTDLAIRLAEMVGGEIVSADSRQVYRGMDIGTAKPTQAQQARVRHHLLDVVSPADTLGLAQFQALATAVIADIRGRGKVPFLVGGTGQYVMAVVEGWQAPQVPPDERLRAELQQLAAQRGPGELFARLQALDPVAAGSIDARNVRRVIRALEVCISTGQPFSLQRLKQPPLFRLLMIGLFCDRLALYERIDRRIDAMISAGLEKEVRSLVAAGYGFDCPAMSGVGYGQFAPLLSGEGSLAEVVAAIRRATRRLVRQQSNWYRRQDPRIHWFDASSDLSEPALALVSELLGG